MKRFVSISRIFLLVLGILLYYFFVFKGINGWYYFDMSYLKCVIYMLLLCLILFSSSIFKNEERTYKNSINLYIILFLILLYSFTFVIGRPGIYFYKKWYYSQLVPFDTIKSIFKYGSRYEILKNIIGNLITLIPLSFLLMLRNDKFKNIFLQALVIIPVIMAIELFQGFTHTGTFDVDDIILNYLGTLVFTLLIRCFHLIDKIKLLFYKDFNLKEKTKFWIYLVSIILFILFVIFIFINKM